MVRCYAQGDLIQDGDEIRVIMLSCVGNGFVEEEAGVWVVRKTFEFSSTSVGIIDSKEHGGRREDLGYIQGQGAVQSAYRAMTRGKGGTQVADDERRAPRG